LVQDGLPGGHEVGFGVLRLINGLRHENSRAVVRDCERSRVSLGRIDPGTWKSDWGDPA
jgi:hypothetical protein